MKKHTARKIPNRIKHGRTGTLRQLTSAARRTMDHREMNAAESPEVQDSWDALKIAVLEAERILQKPIDKSRR